MTTSTEPTPLPPWILSLARRREQVSFALFGVAAALLGVALFLRIKTGWDYDVQIVLAILFGLAFGGVGLWLRLIDPATSQLTDREIGYLVVLLVAGLIGLAMTVESVAWGYAWWDVVSGGPEKWRGADGWKLMVVIALEIVGLALIFAGLANARTDDHDHPVLRRLLYGYVAVLTGLLLFEILLALNVGVFLYKSQPSDWTASKIYTLDDQSVRILEALEKPVRVVHVLSTRQTYRYDDVNRLLENARGASRKFSYDEVLRHSMLSRTNELREKYFVDEDGLLVLYGEDKEQSYQFIKADELYERAGMARDRRPDFKGEDALMTTIGFLSEGKSKPMIYFTQGNEELDIGAAGFAAGLRPEQRGSSLVRKLEEMNFDIKGLMLGSVGRPADPNKVIVADKVPDDAAVVVVAGPRKPLSEQAVAALRSYISTPNAKGKKGTLLFLAGLVVDHEGRVVPTGLEGLMAEHGVELGNSRVMALKGFVGESSFNRVPAVANPRLVERRHPIATQLFDDERMEPFKPIPMLDARPVRPQGGGPGAPPQAEELLVLLPTFQTWAETNLTTDASTLVKEMFKTAEGKKQLSQKLSTDMLPVAVTVSESSRGATPPGDPHAFMDRGGESKPRMVVVGNSAFVSDRSLERSGAISEYSIGLVASSLAWLRERPNSLKIPARSQQNYQMSANTDIWKMILSPAWLLTLGVVGLGLGVWVVRRR